MEESEFRNRPPQTTREALTLHSVMKAAIMLLYPVGWIKLAQSYIAQRAQTPSMAIKVIGHEHIKTWWGNVQAFNATAAPSGDGRRRLKKVKIFLGLLWGATLIFHVFAFYSGLRFFVNSLKTPQQAMSNTGFGDYSNFADYFEQAALFNVVADLWCISGLVLLMWIYIRRIQGVNTPRVKDKYLIAALLMPLGRIGGFWWGAVASLIPDYAWWVIFPKYALLPPLVLFASGCTAILALYFGIAALVLGLFVLPTKIFGAAFQIYGQITLFRTQRSAFFQTLTELWCWFSGRAAPSPPVEEKGARFATAAEAHSCLDKDGATFGYLNGQRFRLKTDKHVLLLASTRSGKGASIIIPHLLDYRGSAFVLDPKGENAARTGRRRETLNDIVHYLDPFGISGKPQSRFNPLKAMTVDNMEAESASLAAALIIGRGDHWTGAAQELLSLIIMYVVSCDAIPQELKDLKTVRQLLRGNLKDTLENCKTTPMDQIKDGLLAQLAKSFLETPDSELGSIYSTARRETRILDIPEISACLSASGQGTEVDFGDWHTKTMTVYLCLAAPRFPVLNRWLRLVLTSALDGMTNELNPPPLPVCFMLDEVATLGNLACIENAVGLAAGYGVQLWNVFQDIPQMRDIYKARWSSFWGNAGVRIAFAVEDVETAEYLSKSIGHHLVRTTNSNIDNWGQVKGQSQGETMRPLLSSDALVQRYAKQNMNALAFVDGQRPIELERRSYFENSEYAGMWDSDVFRKIAA